MNLGLLIITISLLGSASNWMNWQFLNYSIVRFFYCIGAVVHETSHAILCFFTGAQIVDISFFSKKPYVVHLKSKIPFLGELLISLAPIIGGLLFLFLINKYLLQNSFAVPELAGWQDILQAPLKILSQINLLDWKSWLMIMLFLNAGAMIGPSWQDLKNIWPAIIVLLFFNSSWFDYLGSLAVALILTNVFIQIFFIIFIETIKGILGSLILS